VPEVKVARHISEQKSPPFEHREGWGTLGIWGMKVECVAKDGPPALAATVLPLRDVTSLRNETEVKVQAAEGGEAGTGAGSRTVEVEQLSQLCLR
jgi:hypothetical protein